MKTKRNFILIILLVLLVPILLLANSSMHNTNQVDELEISSREYPTANANDSLDYVNFYMSDSKGGLYAYAINLL